MLAEMLLVHLNNTYGIFGKKFQKFLHFIVQKVESHTGHLVGKEQSYIFA
jgi:hypothetical protein